MSTSPSPVLPVELASVPTTPALPPLVRPLLRGWIHLGALVVAVAMGVVLTSLAQPSLRLGVVVYSVSICLLFGTSALYHLRSWRWSTRARGVISRLDHSFIFVMVAGSYTPFALALPRPEGLVLLLLVWSGAVLGVVVRNWWRSAPRFVAALLYLLLGWAVVGFLPSMLSALGVPVLVLIGAGGLLYSLGALVYAWRRPDPSPRVFGFHKVFHALTVLAAAMHAVAVFFVVV